MLHWNEIFNIFIPRICWLYGWLFGEHNSLNMFTLPLKRVKGNLSIFLIRRLLSSQDFTGHRGWVFIREKFPSFLYLPVFFSDILISSDREFVFRFRACARCRRSVIVPRKRELSQKPNLCLWGTCTFSPKNLCTEKEKEKFSRQIILISLKTFKRYVARF